MKRTSLICLSLIVLSVLAACGPVPATEGAAQGTDSAGSASATATPCANPVQVIDSLYAADDADQYNQSVSYLTDDVSLVFWAEGVNGRHMTAAFAVGKDQIQDFLKKPGMRTKAAGPNLPNFTRDRLVASPTKVAFMLEPDRKHPDGTPYNPYSVEVFFNGCKIELIKLVERVTWL
jgi:hypothetical protein